MLDITFKTSLGHIASSLHELYSVLRLASFGPPKTKLPLITPARVQALFGGGESPPVPHVEETHVSKSAGPGERIESAKTALATLRHQIAHFVSDTTKLAFL